ncbi:hypothetical protein GLAREA_10962 [Glarea lozoyensis ATCC 20868]|uniref:Uncharacterized protein n=2 Tax=Glarea lozoyensis TaxID=101852 RepID=S3DC24_GLAL2|nr:uncharacterized protein GLAREA_10962 [Glarea lozoyensis ATCC 20868]EPE35265.1 hypothetical protein GLAREA_10962 [Glarea lozoyensis ATCC 20868]
MWALPSIEGGWHLDAFASFIMLVGEDRELEYRRSQHRWSSLFSFPAPVAGLQSYLHSNYKIIDRTGMEYISPYNSNKAQLRNVRIEAIIQHYNLLRDRAYYRFIIPQIDAQAKIPFLSSAWRKTQWPGFTLPALCLSVLLFWGTCGVFFWAMARCPKTTWIGNSLCISLGVWSFIVRLIDLCCIVPSGGGVISGADRPDAAIFLGRRNSCLVLEGLRKDISSWTGRGLTEWDNQPLVFYLTTFRQVGTLAMLLFILATIPNGTIADQVGFITYNGIGQLNLMACNNLSMARYLYSLRQTDMSNIETRTHVYSKLITHFRDKVKPTTPDWVDTIKLLPDTPQWKLWKTKVLEGNSKDAKVLYDECGVTLHDQEVHAAELRNHEKEMTAQLARRMYEDAQNELAAAKVARDALDLNSPPEELLSVQARVRAAEDAFNLLEGERIANLQIHVP